MKEFNLILDKVSQALGITVDSVVKLYPQLRTEYSWYYVCDNLQNTSLTAIVVILVLSGMMLLPPIMVNDHDEEDYIKASKLLKWALVVVGVFAVLLLLSTLGKGFLCPDIMIIKEFIK